MSNELEVVSVEAPLVDGGLLPLGLDSGRKILQSFREGRLSGDYFTGKEIIDGLVTDDWGAPPVGVRIALRRGRHALKIFIPYGDTSSDEIADDMRRVLG